MTLAIIFFQKIIDHRNEQYEKLSEWRSILSFIITNVHFNLLHEYMNENSKNQFPLIIINHLICIPCIVALSGPIYFPGNKFRNKTDNNGDRLQELFHMNISQCVQCVHNFQLILIDFLIKLRHKLLTSKASVSLAMLKCQQT